MSVNLFLRPLADATVQYEYKTDVLSTYNNLEDRIAQRDIPRIFFNYNYAINDYKKAIDLDTELQKNGNVGSVWLPDWFSGVEVNNIVNGINTISVSKFVNLTESQVVLIFADDYHYEVSQIRSVTINDDDAEIEFRSTGNYSNAYIMPVFKCFLNGDNQQSRINTLSNTFNVQAVVKTPVFSPIRSHDVQFLGHDVLCDNFKIETNEPSISVYQQVQENDYEIGLKDRFTFFNRMYSSFAVTIMAKQNELDYVRNFIKRRWGKTYSCFIPSGVADFVKFDNGQLIANSLVVVNSDYDFTARPFMALYKDNEVWYVKVVSANKGAEVTTLSLDSHITHVILDQNSNVVNSEEISEVDIYPSDLDCIQSLFFARFDDDTISFEIAGNSEDFQSVYKIEMPFIETEFYDSDNINYDTADAVVFDKDVVTEFKSYSASVVPNNDVDNSYTMAVKPNVTYETISGKYDDTYAWRGCSIIDKVNATSEEKDANNEVNRWLINDKQDFVIQLECKFDYSTTASGSGMIMTAFSSHNGIDIGTVKGCDNNIYPYVGFAIKHNGISPRADADDTIVITKYSGDLFNDWHEIAIQRTNGVTYVYCDGYLNGSSISCHNEKLFKGKTLTGRFEVYYIDFFGSHAYNYLRCGYVQQFRLMLNKNIYTGTQMSTMNRIYNLFDYSLEQLVVMDNATIIKTDFVYDCLRDNWRACPYRLVVDNMMFTDLDTFGQGLCQHPFAQYEQTVAGNTDDPCKWSSVKYLGSDMKRGADHIDLSSRYFHLSLSKYKLPFRWHKDLWLEFDISKTGEVSDKQVLLYAESIMPTIYFSDDKWTVGAWGLNPNDYEDAVWNDVSEHLNVAISIDSQYNRVCVYIDGQLSLSDTLINVILRNEHGSIGFYPLISEKVNLALHNFRLVDCCLTHEDAYSVIDMWKLGFRTTFFDFEFGRKHEETYPALRIVNINNIYELAPLYDVFTNVDYKKNYTYQWSDGSRSEKITNPQGNTLYTVVVTDRTTNDKGYGWFFVHKDFTGEICRSNMSCTDSYDDDGNAVHTDHFGLIRYDFNEQKYRDTAFWHSQMTVVQDDNGYRLSSGSYYAVWDFFGEVDENTFVPPYVVGSYSSFKLWKAYHRYYLDNYVKQIEYVIFPQNWTASSFYTNDNIAFYYSQSSPLSYTETTRFYPDESTYDYEYHNYFDYLNSRGGNVVPYNAGGYGASYWYDDPWNNVYTPKYTIYKNQDIMFQSVCLRLGDSDSGYYSNSSSYYPNRSWIALERNYMKPIHLVLEPMIMPMQTTIQGTYANGNMTIVYKNIWINGKRYNLYDLLHNSTIPNYPVNSDEIVFNGIPQDPKDFYMSSLSFPYVVTMFPTIQSSLHGVSNSCFDFVKKIIGNIGGSFGCDYNRGKKNNYISNFACYDYAKYTDDFDATEKLNNYK